MAKVEIYRCDGCDIDKKISNHWVIVESLDDENGRHLNFRPWDPELIDRPGTLHLCGAGCAGKLLSRTIPTWQDAPTEATKISEHGEIGG